jgi:hypothetical protein
MRPRIALQLSGQVQKRSEDAPHYELRKLFASGSDARRASKGGTRCPSALVNGAAAPSLKMFLRLQRSRVPSARRGGPLPPKSKELASRLASSRFTSY